MNPSDSIRRFPINKFPVTLDSETSASELPDAAPATTLAYSITASKLLVTPLPTSALELPDATPATAFAYSATASKLEVTSLRTSASKLPNAAPATALAPSLSTPIPRVQTTLDRRKEKAKIKKRVQISLKDNVKPPIPSERAARIYSLRRFIGNRFKAIRDKENTNLKLLQAFNKGNQQFAQYAKTERVANLKIIQQMREELAVPESTDE